ncbi:MAG: hypothetical protein HY726_03205 [Candidatus Rokubacteria bacterium]|nr:hypothetical protein [Candidatus Rokubacteria bacterium]
MATDYGGIRDENIRRYGEDDWYGPFLAGMYSDRTHFLLELLQNAQDARATRLHFEVFADRLELRHDGRLFDEADVRAICGLAKSTNADDPTRIGRFGIGFKSVYAYTTRPEIHSGSEHFAIEKYVRPFAAPAVEPGNGWTTLFIFPFDRDDIEPTQAARAICARLESLSPRTLLFLQDVKEVEWATESGKRGQLVRTPEEGDGGRGVRIGRNVGGSTTIEEWLIFERPVELVAGRPLNRVEVAFLLHRDPDTGKAGVVPAHDTELVVFFPTARETHLGFLVQGPYVPTATRDNVPDNHPLNRCLASETAKLLTHSLYRLRKLGLLSVAALQTLPLRLGDFPLGSLLRPLYDAVKDALLSHPLLPTANGRHVPAKEARLARGAGLREAFDGRRLAALLGEQRLSWATPDISENRTVELYRYLVGYQSWSKDDTIPALVPGFEVTWDTVVARLTAKFLEAQDDRWVMRLYQALADQRALVRDLRTKPIVRQADGRHVSPIDANGAPLVWLPPEDETTFPTVKRTLAEDDRARQFLVSLGLSVPDVADEVIERILPRYRKQQWPSESKHIRDIEKIFRALGTDSREKRSRLLLAIRETQLLRGVNAHDGSRKWLAPPALYLRTPDLTCFLEGNPDAWFLDHCYPEGQPWDQIGVNDDFVVSYRAPRHGGYVPILSSWGWHKRGLKGFDPDFDVYGLEHALRNPTVERSKLAWNLLTKYSTTIRGKVEKSTRQTFEGSMVEDDTSRGGRLATDLAWVPDKQGGFHTASALRLDDLPEGFERNERLADALHMIRAPRAEVAQALGIDEEDVSIVLRHPDRFRALIQELREAEHPKRNDTDRKPEDHPVEVDYERALREQFRRPQEARPAEVVHVDGKAPDPARRREGVGADIQAGKNAEPSVEDRHRQVLRREWEAQSPEVRAYLKEQYAGRCQICQGSFARRDGEPYFEAKYLVSRTEARWIDRPGNAICLCPTCLAKFLYGSVESDDIIEQILSFRARAEGGTVEPLIRLRLCDVDVALRFTERHLLDVQTLLATSTE